jgi:hypothetical protein
MRRYAKLLTAALMLAAMTGAAVAGPWEDAFRGDAAAQMKLGDIYANGQGVPQDYGEAARWYRLAANQGDAKAQHRLGDMYFNGQGVPKDFGEAARWYRLAGDWPDYFLEESALKSRGFNFPAHRNSGVSEGVENLLG